MSLSTEIRNATYADIIPTLSKRQRIIYDIIYAAGRAISTREIAERAKIGLYKVAPRVLELSGKERKAIAIKDGVKISYMKKGMGLIEEDGVEILNIEKTILRYTKWRIAQPVQQELFS